MDWLSSIEKFFDYANIHDINQEGGIGILQIENWSLRTISKMNDKYLRLHPQLDSQKEYSNRTLCSMLPLFVNLT